MEISGANEHIAYIVHANFNMLQYISDLISVEM